METSSTRACQCVGLRDCMVDRRKCNYRQCVQRPTGGQQHKVRFVSAMWRDEGRGEMQVFCRVVVSSCQEDLAVVLSGYAARLSSEESMFDSFRG